MNTTQLKELKNKGKIRGFRETKPTKKKPAKLPVKKSKALTWLHNELVKWAKAKNYNLIEELKFHPTRQFRFDFALFELKTAIEFEGGIFLKKSGHNTATHYTKDSTKYNLAVIAGWKVLRYTALNYKDVINDLNEVIKIVNE